MCLDNVLKGKKKREALAKLKDTVVVYKVLIKPNYPDDPYTTDCVEFPVYAGKVKFKQPILGIDPKYRGGGHFWLTKAGAMNWDVGDCEKIVRCTVKKSDINTIGYQCDYPVVVVKKAMFPKYIGKRKDQ